MYIVYYIKRTRNSHKHSQVEMKLLQVLWRCTRKCFTRPDCRTYYYMASDARTNHSCFRFGPIHICICVCELLPKTRRSATRAYTHHQNIKLDHKARSNLRENTRICAGCAPRHAAVATTPPVCWIVFTEKVAPCAYMHACCMRPSPPTLSQSISKFIYIRFSHTVRAQPASARMQ